MKPDLKSVVSGVLLILACLVDPAAAQDSRTAKARALVDTAIMMTESQQAVNLLWQATEIDPALDDAYIYLGLYYNSRSDFANVVKVYKKLVRYHPEQVSAYLNIGEAYMSFTPARAREALPYYRKAYKIDPASSFAALRIGEILAHRGDRNAAKKFLLQASRDGERHPNIAAEARDILRRMSLR